ncbi:MAG: glutamate--tRNA ligase [Spirochaetes bacterium RBG_13_51_14]|nr:MAG: glutamate--tRNA ligase [Spirochaetes bacterium RBG_13_51_14]
MRVRFAPSPTGFLHMGNARTAIINYLIAKKNSSAMVLRIEDTDRERSTRESEESIYRDLAWLGIAWDEGPDVGGVYGPYRQSERFGLYRTYTDRLMREGNAYHCYCTREELEEIKKGPDGGAESYVYSGRCRTLSDGERKKFEADGRKPTVRFRVPGNVPVVVQDRVKGPVEFNSSNIGGDFIIVRSDGIPVFNYIVIIDDALMNISLVIRGDDHLSNTPKQLLVARALDLPEPEYAHLPLIMGPDRSKLSKRHGITSVEMYRKQGYLPEALMNYMAMLGWSSESGAEILPLGEIVRQIDLANLSKNAPVFDFQKLRWMNGNYIRDYPLSAVTDLFIPHIIQAGYPADTIDRGRLEDIVSILRKYCEILSDIGHLAGIFFDEVCEPDEEADTMLKSEDGGTVIRAVRGLIRSELTEENFAVDLISRVKEATSLKGKSLFMPVRAVITGRQKGPELDQAMPLIGYDKCKKRIEYCYARYCT